MKGVIFGILVVCAFVISGITISKEFDNQNDRIELAEAQISSLKADLASTRSQLALTKTELTEVKDVTIPKIQKATEVVENLLGDDPVLVDAGGVRYTSNANDISDLSDVQLDPESWSRN